MRSQLVKLPLAHARLRLDAEYHRASVSRSWRYFASFSCLTMTSVQLNIGQIRPHMGNQLDHTY